MPDMLGPALILVPLVSIPQAWSPDERAAAAAVNEATLAAHIRYLSDDLLEGRGPGSRGEQLAMNYVAAQFERIGLKPAGDHGGYLQRFDIVGMKTEVARAPLLRAGGKTLALAPPVDSVVASGLQQEKTDLQDGEIVFVGYGIDAPEQRWNDFKDFDVRNKVLLVMNNDPENDPASFAGKTRLYYGRWSYKYEEAARRGAAGVIIIHTTPSAGYPWQVVQTSWGREQYELPAAQEPRIAVKMWVTDEAARKLAALGGHDLDDLRRRAESRDFRPVPLGASLSVALATRLRRLTTANVLGRWPGRDAALAEQAVVVSAHHDHLGVGAPRGGDAIYNGALDNASGVASLLALAEGVAHTRPRRSILFASVGMEESGLLGSDYFCTHPVIPAEKIVADLNIDGINIWGRTRDVTSVGLGKSSLDAVVAAAARQQGRTVEPDPFPDRGHFYRSDQFSFARIGIPGVYLRGGTDYPGHDRDWGRQRIEEYERTRYHQPSDQFDPAWDLAGAVDDVRLLGTVAQRVANAPAPPAWVAGDEFATARKRAAAK